MDNAPKHNSPDETHANDETVDDMPVFIASRDEARAIDELFQKGNPLDNTVAYQPDPDKPNQVILYPRTKSKTVSETSSHLERTSEGRGSDA